MQLPLLLNIALAALATSAPTNEKAGISKLQTRQPGQFAGWVYNANENQFEILAQLSETGGCIDFNSWANQAVIDYRFNCRFYSGWGCKNHEQIGGYEGLKGIWDTSQNQNPGLVYRQWIVWSLSATCWRTG